jgi:hypothetical protein
LVDCLIYQRLRFRRANRDPVATVPSPRDDNVIIT